MLRATETHTTSATPTVDAEDEILAIGAIGNLLLAAAQGLSSGEDTAAVTYAARLLLDHEDRLRATFETMVRAHRTATEGLRAELAAAKASAAPGSARARGKMEAYRRLLLEAAETTVEQVRAIADEGTAA